MDGGVDVSTLVWCCCDYLDGGAGVSLPPWCWCGFFTIVGCCCDHLGGAGLPLCARCLHLGGVTGAFIWTVVLVLLSTTTGDLFGWEGPDLIIWGGGGGGFWYI